MRIFSSEVLEERARNLGTLNGIRLVFVSLIPANVPPTDALLDVEFYNANSLAAVLDDIQNNGIPANSIFSIEGGSRLLGGNQPGQVQVQDVIAGATAESLRLRVRPIGDYSTYTLRLEHDNNFDPLFAEVPFKFRPGCFNLNCAPPFGAAAATPVEPAIDYLAKDYHSIKHVMLNAMRGRVPGWQPTSEADLDQVLIDLIAAQADEISDFQDRVINEAYLGRARKRLSVARHARLMDYHLHQGNQAGTWLAVTVSVPGIVLPPEFGVWSGRTWDNSGAAVFKSVEAKTCVQMLNQLALYTWRQAVTALEAGATEAELALPAPLDPVVEVDANALRDTLRDPQFRFLLIEQKLNPETGGSSGIDRSARQIVQLLEGSAAAESVFDPFAGEWFVRVHWRDEDQLKRRYCFIAACTGEPVTEGVSSFHGNLLRATHGRPYETVFRPPQSPLAGVNDDGFVHTSEAYFELSNWGVLCPLPEGPLAYRNTEPGGDTPPRSTLDITVEATGESWLEQTDLIESESDDPHFIVETDESGASVIRFGNGVNGQAWNPAQAVRCRYQTGGGAAGNVGPDSLTSFDASVFAAVTDVWNPLDVVDGREPEPVSSALRRIPEAYRARQLRAVTLQDYIARARELPGVSNAYANYAWTGSWRTVRILVDPANTDTLTEELRLELAGYMDAVRLIGEDVEIRLAQFVSLDIQMTICAHPDYWPEDLTQILALEFSDGYTPDGRLGFFHPNLWTFGQPIYASQLIGRALSVQGVDRVLKVSMRRWDGLIGPNTITVVISPEDVPQSIVPVLEVAPFEVIRVSNDPSHMEKGRILFQILGGRK